MVGEKIEDWGKAMLEGDPAQLVGQRLRELRAQSRLSVRSLAEVCGLSFNTISLIERGKISPTVATLHKLSAALGVPLANFVSDAPPRQVIHSRAQDRRRAHSGGLLLEDLGLGLPDQSLHFLLVTLPPGTGSGPDPITHAGNEFAFCLEGQVEYQVEGVRYTLEPEDSLLFEARLPHCWHNRRATTARLFLVFQSLGGHGGTPHQHLLADAPEATDASELEVSVPPDPIQG